MQQVHRANYLRVHRKRSGLSQYELARLVGYPNETAVSRHERLSAVPPLDVALRYQAVFHVDIALLFPAEYAAACEFVEANLEEMKRELQDSNAKGRAATFVARKLEWMWKRSNPDAALFDDESSS